MKIRSRKALHGVGRLAAAVVRTAMTTAKVMTAFEDPSWHPWEGGSLRNFLVSTWHENLLFGAWYCGRIPHFHAFASDSDDGEIAAGFVESLGMETLRSSSTKGGSRPLNQIAGFRRTKPEFRVGLTLDGPRGPRREMKPGAVYLAARCRLPVMSLGVACRNSLRARSWDNMQIPRPFHRVQFYFTAPIWPDACLARDGLHELSRVLEREANRAQRQAEASLEASLVLRHPNYGLATPA
jgi:lysophospholipid acyltransferase (LPLAT)-like uncharacterized protein